MCARTFFQNVRKLARDQFMARALAQKVLSKQRELTSLSSSSALSQ
jgi:hypothetical protein